MPRENYQRPRDYYPTYCHTNESLDAIVESLELRSTDKVLAICGSGEQAFAMLPYVHSIHAIDMDQNQLHYAKMRVRALKRGDMEGFVRLDLEPERIGAIKYFTKRRVETIRERLDNLSFEITSISRKFFRKSDEKYDKLYLSNADFYDDELEGAARRLISGGLLYFTRFPGEHAPEPNPVLFKEQVRLVRIARRYEDQWIQKGTFGWRPYIFRRKE